jgi:phage I-like protein
MPWHVARSGKCPAGRPWAVVKDADGHVEGCHETEEQARRQLAALYAKENTMADLFADDLRVVGLFALAEGEPSGDPPVTWIQVMLAGKFKHPRHGEFEISEDDLREYAADIEERGENIQIDFDHGETAVGSRAAGWFTGRTELKEDARGRPALFAEIHLTPAGASSVRDREYRFVSPEFSRTHRDATGKLVKKVKLWAAALTNRPFLPEMAPVALSELGVRDLIHANQMIPASMRETLAEKLGVDSDLDVMRLAEWSTAFINDLPDSSFLYIEPGGSKDSEGKTTPRSLRHFPVKDASGKVDLPHVRNAIARAPQSSLPDAVKTRVQNAARRLLSGSSEASDEPETTTPTTDTDVVSTTQGEDMDAEVLKLLELPDHADNASVIAAIKARDEQISQLTEKIAGLQSKSDTADKLARRVTELEARDRGREIEAILTDEVRTGRVLPVEVEQLSEAFADNPDALKTLVNARPPGLFAGRMSAKGTGGTSTGGFAESETRQAARDLRTTENIDEDSAKLHVAAMAILTKRGKEDGYSETDYLSALEEAQRSLVAF